MNNDEPEGTWRGWVERGKHDGYFGCEYNPPKCREDHPFYRVYTSYYREMFRERCRDLATGREWGIQAPQKVPNE